MLNLEAATLPIKQILKEKFNTTFSGIFAVADGSLVVGTNDQHIICLAYPSLEIKWVTSASYVFAQDLFLQHGKVIVEECKEDNESVDFTVSYLNNGEVFKKITLPGNSWSICPPKARSNICIMYDFHRGQGLNILDLESRDEIQVSTPAKFNRAIWDDEILLFYTYDQRFCRYEISKREFSDLQDLPHAARYQWTAITSASNGELVLGGYKRSTLNYVLCRWNYLSGESSIFWRSSIDEIFPKSLMETLGTEPLPSSLKELVVRENEGGWATFLEHVANLYWVENPQILLCSLGGEGWNLAGDTGANTVCLIDAISGKLISKILTESRDSGDMRMLPAAHNEWLMSTSSNLWKISVGKS